MTRHLRAVDGTHSPDPLDEVSEADRVWFEENPYANFRIRRYIAGENPDPGPAPAGFELWVKVTQVIPGVRYRQVGYARAGDLPVTYEPEIDPDLLVTLEALKAKWSADQ